MLAEKLKEVETNVKTNDGRFQPQFRRFACRKEEEGGGVVENKNTSEEVITN